MSPDAYSDFFAEHGYLAVEGLLQAAEIDELRDDLVRLARGAYPCRSLEPLPADVTDAEALERILCIHMPHFVSPTVKRFTIHPAIAEILGRVVGAHLRPGFWDGSVKCMQSMFFAKPPGKPGQAWHQDECYIPTRDRSLCGAWIAIDDATIDNGCLWVVPGSHHAGVLYPQRDHGQPEEFDDTPESYGFDSRGEIPIEVSAGSVVFFNGHLLHRSRRNASSRYRRALVNHYMSMQSPLSWMGHADNRAVHPVCGADPYADRGYVIPDDAVYLRQYQAEPA